MNKFRHVIEQRDHSCLITHIDQCECDAAHIIPHTICEKYAPSFLVDSRNGLFLSKNMHSLFDRWLWTFDVYDLRYNPVNQHYSSRLLIDDTHRHLSIKQYHDQYIEIPIETYPFLYTHYQLFIAFHYERSYDFETFYRETINEDHVFQYLLGHQVPVQSILDYQLKEYLIREGVIQGTRGGDEYGYVNTILKQNDDRYLVWWDYLPLIAASWEPESHLTEQSIQDYQQLREMRHDHDYIR